MKTSAFWNSSAVRSVSCAKGETECETGSALVELALTLPVLVALILGAVELGWVTFASIEVTNAARAGASYGCQNSTSAGDTTGIQNTAALDAVDIPLGTTSVAKSCICSDGTASTCQPTDCSGSSIETILTVSTQATLTPPIRVPGLPATLTLRGQAVEKVLQ
jgi:Flp pilus assembly protein TadG